MALRVGEMEPQLVDLDQLNHVDHAKLDFAFNFLRTQAPRIAVYDPFDDFPSELYPREWMIATFITHLVSTSVDQSYKRYVHPLCNWHLREANIKFMHPEQYLFLGVGNIKPPVGIKWVNVMHENVHYRMEGVTYSRPRPDGIVAPHKLLYSIMTRWLHEDLYSRMPTFVSYRVVAEPVHDDGGNRIGEEDRYSLSVIDIDSYYDFVKLWQRRLLFLNSIDRYLHPSCICCFPNPFGYHIWRLQFMKTHMNGDADYGVGIPKFLQHGDLEEITDPDQLKDQLNILADKYTDLDDARRAYNAITRQLYSRTGTAELFEEALHAYMNKLLALP